MSKEKNAPNWAKIIKIVGEFIVAIITAIFASSYVLPIFY